MAVAGAQALSDRCCHSISHEALAMAPVQSDIVAAASMGSWDSAVAQQARTMSLSKSLFMRLLYGPEPWPLPVRSK